MKVEGWCGGQTTPAPQLQSCSTKTKLVSLTMAVENPMHNFKLNLNDRIG